MKGAEVCGKLRVASRSGHSGRNHASVNKENRKIDAEKTNFTALLLQVIASCGLIKGTT